MSVVVVVVVTQQVLHGALHQAALHLLLQPHLQTHRISKLKCLTTTMKFLFPFAPNIPNFIMTILRK